MEVKIDAPTLRLHLSTGIFTPDAVVQLWGCNLGQHMAHMFVNFVDQVIACEDFVSFDHILDRPDSMPEPVPGASWTTYFRTGP